MEILLEKKAVVSVDSQKSAHEMRMSQLRLFTDPIATMNLQATGALKSKGIKTESRSSRRNFYQIKNQVITVFYLELETEKQLEVVNFDDENEMVPSVPTFSAVKKRKKTEPYDSDVP